MHFRITIKRQDNCCSQFLLKKIRLYFFSHVTDFYYGRQIFIMKHVIILSIIAWLILVRDKHMGDKGGPENQIRDIVAKTREIKKTLLGNRVYTGSTSYHRVIGWT